MNTARGEIDHILFRHSVPVSPCQCLPNEPVRIHGLEIPFTFIFIFQTLSDFLLSSLTHAHVMGLYVHL